MFLAEIGTAGVILANFFKLITSAYSLYASDPIEGQPVQLSYYLCVFGCGLVFWLLELLRAKLHGIRKVQRLNKLITWITTLNLCGSLLAPFMKLPLLVRFLVLFQVSGNLALLLLWAFLSGGRGTNMEHAITELSLMLAVQPTSTLIGFHTILTPCSSNKDMLAVALMDQLVTFLCGFTGILLYLNKPEYPKAAKIFAIIGFVCTALGFILMVAMFVPCYLVLIAVLLFGVVYWIRKLIESGS